MWALSSQGALSRGSSLLPVFLGASVSLHGEDFFISPLFHMQPLLVPPM